jgi:hypothetical protein
MSFIDNCNKNPEILIDGFFDEFRWLSNFHLCEIPYHRFIYPSSENAFQAEKTILLSRRIPFTTCSPNEAKKEGRRLILRKGWENIKLSRMEQILRIKFAIPELKEKLIATGNAGLIEGNYWHDNFWGDCRCYKCEDFEGENQLGILLMKIRGEIK